MKKMMKTKKERDVIGRSGDEIYAKLLAEKPRLMARHQGETIWIDTCCGIYAFGPGLDGAEKLVRKVGKSFYPNNLRRGWEHSEHFYSRNVGELSRAPFGAFEHPDEKDDSVR